MSHALLDVDNLGLSTDLYELTMAAAFLEAGLQGHTATFDLSVRRLPPERGYLVAAGLEQALAYLRDLRFGPEVVGFLESTGQFRPPFLEYLAGFRFTGDVDAVAEGTIVFPPAPMLRVTAPVIEAQVVETYLLTTLTYQSMIASKAARVVEAAAGRTVLDFSPRRDHGPQAGLLCARAAYIGGCDGTSNVLANRHFGVPVSGTMAHSFVMFHRDETQAFRTFSRSYPEDPVLLIDTYDTVQGARNALELLPELRADGRDLAGVRLDSGDLCELSLQVRRVLDEGGAPEARIFASGNLDEYEIERLLAAGAAIDGFGVGTELGTSGDAPSLNSTYKLVACVDDAGVETPVIKLSSGKMSLPGRKQVWRHLDGAGTPAADTIALETETIDGISLLEPAMRSGRTVAPSRSLPEIREHALEQRRSLPGSLRRLREPAPYPVNLSSGLRDMIDTLRRTHPGDVDGASHHD